jgi:predicted HAD superfamily phosphohydrolase YqeG
MKTEIILEKIREMIEEYKTKGYQIHVGNNPKMHRTKKWANHCLIRLTHRGTKYTIWASKLK